MIKTLILAALLALAACGGNPGPVVDTACVWVRPIAVGSADVLTRRTAEEILAHNRAWRANCPNEGSHP